MSDFLGQQELRSDREQLSAAHVGETAADAGACPWSRGAPAAVALRADEELVFPLNKSVVVQHVTGETGKPELRLYYAGHEICFDEPETVPFGEALVRQSRFVAGQAADWAPGLGWPRAQGLLAELLQAGILRRAADGLAAVTLAVTPGLRPAPLPPGPAQAARTWTAHCREIMAEVAGRPLELGYLELVVPIFRVAHLALDAEGRQVGEANVFPKPMRMDVPTRWQTCLFAGSRHQPDRPMNVSALKAMRTHWGQMMVVLAHVREAYLARFPEARAGWTVGHVERLATAVLAVPTWLLMRAERPVENGALHPALSCVFRVTDGLRMVMHQMLFVPFREPTLSPDTPITSAEAYAYAERNESFHSEHGVCAGPQAMVEEFLGVLMDGRPPADGAPMELDRQILEAIGETERALDYALLGLQAYAATFSLWPQMTRSYEAVAAAASAWAQTDAPAALDVSARFQAHMQKVRSATYLGEERWRLDRDAVYADMYAQCVRGLTGAPPDRPLAERLRPRRSAAAAAFTAQLRAALAPRFTGPEGAGHLEVMVETIADFALRTQAVLRLAVEAQGQLNRHLGRPAPRRPFTARDINIHNLLQGADVRRLPYLFDELEAALGLEFTVDGEALECAAAAPTEHWN